MKTYSSIIANKEKHNSYFDKTMLEYIGLEIRYYLILIFSLGLAYPWAICMKQRAICHHTYICGRRLKFIGEPKELIAHWLYWWFLSVITLGLYTFVAHLRMEQWKVANTVFDSGE